MNKQLRKALIGTAFAAGSVLLTLLLFQTNVVENIFGSNIFQALDKKAYDALIRARGERSHTSNVVIVKIDEYTIKQLDYPIAWDQFGSLLFVVSASGAKAIGVDLFFPSVKQDSLSEAQYDAFLKFAAASNNVFHAIGPFVPENGGATLKPSEIDRGAYASLHPFAIPAPHSGIPFPRATYIDERPVDSLVLLASGVGHVALTADPIDGVIRKLPFFIEYAGDYYPTFGAALAFYVLNVDLKSVTVSETSGGLTVHAPMGSSRSSLDIPLTKSGDLMIDYTGGEKPFKEISFYDVLDAFTRGDKETLSMFKDAVVIIGPTARSIGDQRATPLSETAPNCYVHANVYDQIMSGQYITNASFGGMLVILLVLTLVVAVVSMLIKLRWSLPVALVLLAGFLWFAYAAFANTGVVYSLTEPVFAIFFCYAGTMSFISATEGKQKAQIKNMFQRYVDASVVDQLIDNPALLKLGGEEREITTLFADIEGFTRMAEKLGPQNTVGMLNAYLTEMTNVVIEEKGTLDKYIGDAIMAFWGAPLDDADHALHACIAALRMQKHLESLHTKWIHFGKPVVNQRIGLNTGKAVVGNMGAEAKFNYTAVGDAVNLASRLEGVNKEYSTRLLMSEFTNQQVEGKVLAREMDLVVVVGKTEPVKIYELIALADEVQTDATKKFLDLYHAGLDAYKKRAWKSAIEQFQAALQIRKDDVVSNIYIQRSMMFLDAPPPDDWNGVFVMTKK
ncbi:MAG: adenylate/guanylate cyclase domain-containing protein [Bacteroidota bacterium]|nr:adenylate/guanylate cyclase domain-containing protein [Bacteroidota bacterium]